MSKPNVGGQAVIEGVMMRSPRSFSVVVRTPRDTLVVKRRRWISLWDRFSFMRWPFLRGTIVLAESLHNGISALNFSAMVQEESEDAKETPASLWVTVAVAVVMALALFAALPHFLTWGLGKLIGSAALSGGKDVVFHLADGAIKMGIFLGYLYAISRLPDVARIFQYHGAEHKSIYAHELGEELTVENARRHTTLHPRCGTAFLLVVLLIAVVVFSVVFPFIPDPSSIAIVNHLVFILIKLALLFPIAGVSYEVIRMAGQKPDSTFFKVFLWPGLMTQKITTSEPDDSQLEVALASLATALWLEEQLNQGATEVEEFQGEFDSYGDYLATLKETHVPEAG